MNTEKTSRLALTGHKRMEVGTMDKDLIETKDGFSVYLIQDSDAQSPEDNSGDDGDDLLFVVTTSNRYFQCRDEKRDHTPEAVTAGTWKKTHWAFPLFMYAHSGVALSLGRGGQFSDPWDSGQVGFVLVNKKAEPHWRLQANALKAAECLVEQWNQYLSGDVWGYVVEGPDGE